MLSAARKPTTKKMPLSFLGINNFRNWSGNNGAIKVHSKTTSGCYIVLGGNFSTSRAVDWFAFEV